jgi:hypothetical protein
VNNEELRYNTITTNNEELRYNTITTNHEELRYNISKGRDGLCMQGVSDGSGMHI